MTLWVAGVESWHFRSGTRHTVFCRTAPTQVWSVKIFTWNDWKASLCQEAYRLGKAIEVETKDDWWGREILIVKLSEPETQPQEVA